MNKNQLEISEKIIEFVKEITYPITAEKLIYIRNKMYSRIVIRHYDDTTMEHEKSIRWKRTSAQILSDEYVYNGKSCTDLTVLFLAFCKVLNLETRFVKLKKEKFVHSVAEIKLEDDWYMFDISNKNNLPVKGKITDKNHYKDWRLWKKGRDSWDLDLTSFQSIEKIR